MKKRPTTSYTDDTSCGYSTNSTIRLVHSLSLRWPPPVWSELPENKKNTDGALKKMSNAMSVLDAVRRGICCPRLALASVNWSL